MIRMNTRKLCLLGSVIIIATTSSGCLRRRAVIIHQTVPPTVVVQSPVTVYEAPPPPCVEAQPPIPSSAHVWVEGCWEWDQRWVWRPGVWVVRPRPHAVWVSGRWMRRGNVWVLSPGHWR